MRPLFAAIAGAVGASVIFAVFSVSIVRAGHQASPRTHVVVRESRIKQLFVTSPGPGSFALEEILRDGTSVPYVVPTGRVFVLTDIRFGAPAGTTLALTANGVFREDFLVPPGTGDVFTLQFTTGLAFDPGTVIGVTAPSSLGVQVHGYEVDQET